MRSVCCRCAAETRMTVNAKLRSANCAVDGTAWIKKRGFVPEKRRTKRNDEKLSCRRMRVYDTHLSSSALHSRPGDALPGAALAIARGKAHMRLTWFLRPIRRSALVLSAPLRACRTTGNLPQVLMSRSTRARTRMCARGNSKC